MLHLTLRQLQVFEAVARLASVTRASEELHLTQPAVSMQIKQLEETAGLPLLEQVGKKLFLTDAGREMQRAGQSIAQQLLDLEKTLDDLKGLTQGSLTVGVVSTVSYFATRIMARFRQLHPEVRITLNVVNRETLLNQLAENAIDLAIMGQPPAGLDLVAEPLMENPLVVIAPPRHPLAGDIAIPLERLAREDFLAREIGSGTRGALENFFHAHGLDLKVSMEMNSNEAIKQAVEVGLGLGIVSLHTVDAELAAARLCMLNAEGFPIVRQWYLVHRKGKRFSAAPQAFAEFILEEARRAAAEAAPSERPACL